MAKQFVDVASSITPTEYGAGSPAITKSQKELSKEKLENYIKEETKLVKGVFQLFDNPGATHRVMVRKYPGVPMFDKVMQDGMEYEIPLYVARHLNGIDVTAERINGKIGSCSYPVHGFLTRTGDLNPSNLGEAPGFSGIPVPIVGVQKRVKRFGFQSMEFAGTV
jgi:hypothetical protein